jgi:hypothetical protein
MLTLTAVIHREEDMYVAECPGGRNGQPKVRLLKKLPRTSRRLPSLSGRVSPKKAKRGIS